MITFKLNGNITQAQLSWVNNYIQSKEEEDTIEVLGAMSSTVISLYCGQYTYRIDKTGKALQTSTYKTRAYEENQA